MPTARNAVVEIVAQFPSGRWNAASGVVGDQNTVFTSNHVLVYNNELASSVRVTYTTADGATHEITVSGDAIHLNVPANQWPIGDVLTQAQSGMDFASISLPEAIGLETGWFGLNTGFRSGQVHLSGYPVHDNPLDREYEEVSASYVDSLNNASELLNITPTTFGQGYSGGAVWMMHNGAPDLVGIISAGNANRGRAADISTTSAPKITGWLTSDDGAVADAVNRAHVTKIFEIGFGSAPTDSELGYWAGQLATTLSLPDAYSLAATSTWFQVGLLYDTLFNRPPTAEERTARVNELAQGTSFRDIEASLLASPEFQATPGARSAGAFVDQTATNILGFTVAGAERDYWVGQTNQNGQLAVLDAVSTPDVNALHLSIIGSINPLDAGILM